MKKKIVAVMFSAACFTSLNVYAGNDGASGTITFTGDVSGGTCTAPVDFAAASVHLGDVGQNEMPQNGSTSGRLWDKVFNFTDCSPDIANVTTTVTFAQQGNDTRLIKNQGTSTNIVAYVTNDKTKQSSYKNGISTGTSFDSAVNNGEGTVHLYGALVRNTSNTAISNGTLSYPINLVSVYH
ncbi:fimbrial protein [Enterobacter ludwigii]|uniref:fimbrial protein n=1 Tax=Enterobacter ludwigii TaxID=299767 RepID=UPI003975FF25